MNSIEFSPFREASLEISRILWNQKVHCRFHTAGQWSLQSTTTYVSLNFVGGGKTFR